jgi:hypothetical protein
MQPAPSDGARYIGDLTGCYVFSSRDKIDGRLEAYPCRSRSLIPDKASLNASVAGDIGEPVGIKLNHIGILRGRVERRTEHGFIVELVAESSERVSLASRLDWLRRFQRKEASELRHARRWLPRDPRSTLILSKDARLDCFVLDLSVSGAAIQAAEISEVGRHVGVGAMIARVVRHIEDGFAVRFLTPQEDAAAVERLLSLERAGRDEWVKALDEAGAIAQGQMGPSALSSGSGNQY